MSYACVSYRGQINLGLLLAIALAAQACSPLGVAAGGGAAVGIASVQERGVSGAVDDTKIRARINYLWFEESEELLSSVNLQVQEGRVLLTGKVKDPSMRLTAVRLAWQADGVKEVINEIEVSDKSSLRDYSRDLWIGTQLRSDLLLDRRIKSVNYSIETVNQVVYLIGVAQNQAELDRVINHARNLAYVRRVISYVRLKDTAASQTSADSSL
jgi:osmotically-inducible protein OsmY